MWSIITDRDIDELVAYPGTLSKHTWMRKLSHKMHMTTQVYGSACFQRKWTRSGVPDMVAAAE